MRTRTGVLAVAAVAATALTGCAQPGGGDGDGPAAPVSAFGERAEVVAEVWRTHPPGGDWEDGFVPLSAPTVIPSAVDGGGPPDEATSQALTAGFYALDTSLPDEAPAEGTVEFAGDESLTVGLISAAEAYDAIATEPPEDCGEPVPPPAASSTGGPDDPTSHRVPCTVLRVTGAELGTVETRTSRGTATAPAWLFSVEGLDGPVARLAVAPEDVAEPEPVKVPDPPAMPGTVAAQTLVSADGAELVYTLGVGACDTAITPLFLETAAAVVVGGSVTRPDAPCVDLLKYEPVTITLSAPLGDRPVVSGHTGQVLSGDRLG